MRIVKGYADLPSEARKIAGEIGEMSSDLKDGPIAAQSWWILNSLRLTVEAAGGTLNDVVKLTQFFRSLRDFPIYNRIRANFLKHRRPAPWFRCSSFCRRPKRCSRSRPSPTFPSKMERVSRAPRWAGFCDVPRLQKVGYLWSH